MKILKTQSAVLTNHEVSTHISRLLSRSSSSSSSSSSLPENLTTILRDTTTYLSSRANDASSPLPPTMTEAQVRALTRELWRKGLEKGEVLMVLNLGLREGDVGLLDCVVEECDERLGEEVQGEVLEMVGRVVAGGGVGGGVNGMGGEKDGGMVE